MTATQQYLTPLDAQRITKRIAKDHSMPLERAAKVLEGAVQFLELAAKNPKQNFVPSQEVDKGWHTLLMYTRTYQALCLKLNGGFIHHEPSDGERKPEAGGLKRTKDFMRQVGISFDESLWGKRLVKQTCDTDGEGGDSCNGKIEAADCSPDPCTCCSANKEKVMHAAASGGCCATDDGNCHTQAAYKTADCCSGHACETDTLVADQTIVPQAVRQYVQ